MKSYLPEKSSNVPASITDDNTIIDPIEIAEDSNNLFSSVVTNIHNLS